MIPILGRGNNNEISRISDLIGISTVEKEALASIIKNPRNISEILYLQDVLRRMKQKGYDLIQNGPDSQADSRSFVYVVRHGIVAEKGYTGVSKQQAYKTPFFVISTDTSENDFYVAYGEISAFELALLNTPDYTAYFDKNGVRIDDDNPTDYAYAYTWNGVGYSNDTDYWQTIFKRKMYQDSGAYSSTQLTCKIDLYDVTLSFSTSLSSGSPKGQWDYDLFKDEFTGFEFVSDPGEAVDLSIAARVFVSR